MGKWGLDYECEKDFTLTIKATRDRWIKAKHDLEDAKYLENLIRTDYLRSIKSYMTSWDYRLPSIKSAIDELQIKDKRKKKPSLNCLNAWVKEDFFADVDVEININKIITCGYEEYAYQLEFNIDDQEYAIYIPNKKSITTDNLYYAYEGQFAFMHRTSQYSTSVEFVSYKEEEMANYIKTYFNEVNYNAEGKEI